MPLTPKATPSISLFRLFFSPAGAFTNSLLPTRPKFLLFPPGTLTLQSGMIVCCPSILERSFVDSRCSLVKTVFPEVFT